MKWRVIPFRYYEPFEKISFNEISLGFVQKTKQPLFWISGWNINCINLGVGQNYEKILNLENIQKDNVKIVRRQGGGGATYLSKEGEISWAMIYHDENFNVSNLEKIYEKNLQFLISSLKYIGIDSNYKAINDIVTEKGKISGSTLKHEEGVTYFAGTLLYSIDKYKVKQYLMPERDNYKPSLPEKDKQLSSILDFIQYSFTEIVEKIQEEFLKEKKFELLDWTEEEFNEMKLLVSKYSSDSWVKYGKL
jgi:lipoate-protein ligase A